MHLAGEFDLASEAGFKEQLERARADASLVVLNLDQLEFMDSTGLRCVLFATTRLEEQSPRVVITRPQGQIAKLFERSGLFDQIEFAEAAAGESDQIRRSETDEEPDN